MPSPVARPKDGLPDGLPPRPAASPLRPLLALFDPPPRPPPKSRPPRRAPAPPRRRPASRRDVAFSFFLLVRQCHRALRARRLLRHLHCAGALSHLGGRLFR